MKRPDWIKGLRFVVLTGATYLVMSCGGGNNSASAPAPSTPAPAPAAPSVPGTNCPLNSGGVPVNQNGSPIFGSLQSSNNGYWGNQNSLTLSLSFINYTGPGSYVQSVIGSGSLVFPDLSLLLGTQTNTNYNICVNSNNIGAAGSNPGTYSMGNGAVSLTLNGVVQVPLYNPYTSYPGSYQTYPSNQYGQQSLLVSIGTNCAAYVVNNRLVGCVSVRLGNSPYSRVLNYYSR